MKNKHRIMFAFIMAVSLIILSVATPTVGEEKTEEEEGCSVSGLVYVAGTEKPIREAAIIIHRIIDSPEDMKETERRNYITVTNGEGYYEFIGIQAGKYNLVVVYGSNIEWDWGNSPYVCMGTFGSIYAWIDVNTAGIYHTSFEVEDGESIVINIPIDPKNFYKYWEHTFSPMRTYENIYYWLQDAGFTITGPRGNSVAIRSPGILPPP